MNEYENSMAAAAWEPPPAAKQGIQIWKNILVAVCGLVVYGATKAHAAELGSIVVYRQWSLVGLNAAYQFNINHGAKMFVRNGTFNRIDLPAGDYVVSHDHLFMTPEDPQPVHVQAGKTVYFQYTNANPFFILFEVADDQEQAARRVATMKETK